MPVQPTHHVILPSIVSNILIKTIKTKDYGKRKKIDRDGLKRKGPIFLNYYSKELGNTVNPAVSKED